MSSESQTQGIAELSVDTGNLYREEVFTDLKVATIRRLVPVHMDGTPDDSRPALYTAQTTLMSQAGPIPVESPIAASSLEEAASLFPQEIQKVVDRLVEEAKEIRRREATRIVVPGSMPPGGSGGGGMPPSGGGIIGG